MDSEQRAATGEGRKHAKVVVDAARQGGLMAYTSHSPMQSVWKIIKIQTIADVHYDKGCMSFVPNVWWQPLRNIAIRMFR